eukprot:m.235309 g.235309  ORF g.235309 m.235309 type:complete len:56 (-) comp19334_c0_seq1:478-645(-)
MALMASLHATQLEIYNLEIAQNVQELLYCSRCRLFCCACSQSLRSLFEAKHVHAG